MTWYEILGIDGTKLLMRAIDRCSYPLLLIQLLIWQEQLHCLISLSEVVQVSHKYNKVGHRPKSSLIEPARRKTTKKHTPVSEPAYSQFYSSIYTSTMAATGSGGPAPVAAYQPPSKNNPYPGQHVPPALGKLVRMRALRPVELPAHPDLAPQQSSGSPPELQRFVLDVLEEAESFMSKYLVQTFKVKDKSKTSPPSTATHS